MKTHAELITDIQAELGESSSSTIDLLDDLASAESADTIESIKQHLLEARATAESIMQNITDQLARIRDARITAHLDRLHN